MEEERPARRGPLSEEELERELARLSAEARDTLAAAEADAARLAAEAGLSAPDAEAAHEGGEEAQEGGDGLGTTLVVGLVAVVGLLIAWRVFVRPLLALGFALAVVAVVVLGVVKLLELGRGGRGRP